MKKKKTKVIKLTQDYFDNALAISMKNDHFYQKAEVYKNPKPFLKYLFGSDYELG